VRITRIEIRTVSIPFKKPYITSRAIQTTVDHVIVTMYTDEGIIGYGEGAPSKNMLEFPMDAIALCIERYLAPVVIGLDPRNMAKLHSTMDATVVANVYAKAALDIAAYDVAGKSLGVPVYTLLGGCYRSRIPLTKSIGMNIPEDPEKIKNEAAEIAKQGWRVVKLKGSGNPDEDILRVKAAREGIEAAGSQIPIRIDPNCGYTGADVALRAFRVMETFNLDLIEQPLPRWDFQGMTELCGA